MLVYLGSPYNFCGILTVILAVDRASEYPGAGIFACERAYPGCSNCHALSCGRSALLIVSPVPIRFPASNHSTSTSRIILNPSDMTIPVLARQLKYSTSPSNDTQICAAALYMLHPINEKCKPYITTNPPSPPSQLLSRIYLGVSPPPTSSLTKQANALVAIFVNPPRTHRTDRGRHVYRPTEKNGYG